MPGISLPGGLLAAYANEGAATVSTNPPSPTIQGVEPSAQERRYQHMSSWDRWTASNLDMGRSIEKSIEAFIHHPAQELAPMVKAGVTSSISPYTDPRGTLRSIESYYRQKGPIDGTMQAVYSLTTAGGAGALAVGGVAALGTVVGLPLAGVAAGAMVAIEALGAAGVVSNGVQMLFDEAQSAAPEQGLRIPRWVPFLGGKQIFKPTTHQQQVDLLKFDALNVGGSAIVWGIAKLHETAVERLPVNAKRVHDPGLLDPGARAAYQRRQAVVVGAEGATMAAELMAMTPLSTSNEAHLNSKPD